MDRGVWWAIVHGVAKSGTQLVSYSPPGSSVHGISQARVLQLGAIAFSTQVLDLTYKGLILFHEQQKFLKAGC